MSDRDRGNVRFKGRGTGGGGGAERREERGGWVMPVGVGSLQSP